MPSSCVIPSCETKYTHSAIISYHKFPFGNAPILEKWSDFVNRERNSTSWKPSRWSSLCNKHFVASDFKDQKSGAVRKHLKSDAYPTVVLKENVPNLQNPDPDVDASDCDRICRLCGLKTTEQNTVNFHGNLDLLALLVKYLPSVSVDNNDILPKEICLDKCYEKLQNFAQFVENVNSVQLGLREKFYPNNRQISLDGNRFMMKIKQEPIVKIKEEMMPINFNYSSPSNIDEFDPNFNQFLNCDDFFDMTGSKIMEITDLTKVFIDLADNLSENEEMENSELAEINSKPLILSPTSRPNQNKIEIISSIPILKQERLNEEEEAAQTGVIFNEHSYSKSPIRFDKMFSCKTEKKEESYVPKIHIIDYSLFKHKCDICFALFENVSSMNDHKKLLHQKRYSCKTCRRDWTEFPSFYKHKVMCLKKFSFSQRKLYKACDYCHFLTKSRKALINHVSKRRCLKVKRIIRKMKSKQKEDKNMKSPPSSPQILRDITTDLLLVLSDHSYQKNSFVSNMGCFVCDKCSRQFRSVNGLRIHELVHANLKPVTCETCGKSFRSQSNLKQHRLTHMPIEQVQLFSCDQCPKKFRSQCGLGAHVRNKHLHQRPFPCLDCGRTFALKTDMKRCKHVKKH